MRRTLLPTAALLATTFAACADAPTSTGPLAPGSLRAEESEGRGYFQRYVAIGTSISAGVASDGNIFGAQQHSWPAQLARLAHREMTLPLIDEPGCGSPLVAPLIGFRRANGDFFNVNDDCGPNVEGVVLPTQNVAVDGASTREALAVPPELAGSRGTKMSRILPPGMTQVTAMMAQNPKVVTVELGANDLLGARSGIAIPGVTLTRFDVWAPTYDAVLDSVSASGAKAVAIVGLTDDVAAFPAFRTGSEIHGEKAVLQGFGVIVSDDCAASANILFVPVVVPAAIATAGLTKTPQTLSCADRPGQVDYTLTPSDQAVVNDLLARMNAHIATRAAERGWATFKLSVLFERPEGKEPYSVLQQMMSMQPYGPYISFDGYHPSAAGQSLLAAAAAEAFDRTYGMSIAQVMEGATP